MEPLEALKIWGGWKIWLWLTIILRENAVDCWMNVAPFAVGKHSIMKNSKVMHGNLVGWSSHLKSSKVTTTTWKKLNNQKLKL